MSAFLLRRALPSHAARAFSTTSARSSFAKITIIGHLTATPELRATSTGQEILKYAIATNSGPKDNQKTSFFNVTAFTQEGPQRDFISSLDKGTLVYLEGEATMSQYQDAEGKAKSALNIVQKKLDILSPKKE